MMSYENNDLYYPDSQEQVNDIDSTVEGTERTEEVQEMRSDTPHMSFNPAMIAYGAYKVQEIQAVKDFVHECKESFSDKMSEARDTAVEFITHLGDNIREFSIGVYDSVASFFQGSMHSEATEAVRYSREFSENREFGLEHCVEAAQEYFNPGVINEWSSLSDQQRAEICCGYADEVANAFELNEYNGVIFEQMEPGTFGYNNGDGYIHVSSALLASYQTPLNLVDTITHELRHQYQSECVEGHHDVSDKVRNEWTLANAIYTDQPAWCYDPWGYNYNPLEIDSRYAGETVVREITSIMFNDAISVA